MKRSLGGATLASLIILAAAGCSASQEEIYWDAFDTGAKVATSYVPPPKDPRCFDGSITDTAEHLMACSGFDTPSQGFIHEQCGEQMPDDVADRAVWMEGCTDGANDSPKYEVYGNHP
ncbi:hypothetical protein ACFYWN_00430 [Streptomyces sp. NPDC002917]|uniref:hypothetical protein n=1 Tax=Streptomyces sp. NPDC002917 TaxID=3364671 RepID=UPI0036D12025